MHILYGKCAPNTAPVEAITNTFRYGSIVLVHGCCCVRPATKSIERVKKSLMGQFPDASEVQIIDFKHDQDDGLTKPWLPTPSCASCLRALARERRAEHKDVGANKLTASDHES
jgi:hypothetical protein